MRQMKLRRSQLADSGAGAISEYTGVGAARALVGSAFKADLVCYRGSTC